MEHIMKLNISQHNRVCKCRQTDLDANAQHSMRGPRHWW